MKAHHWLPILIATAAPSFALAQTGLPSAPEVVDEQIGDNLGITATTGILYSSGDYGATQETNILVAPFSLRARSGPLRVSATLPYLRIDSPGIVVGGGDIGPIIIDPNAPVARTKRDGFGDLTLGAAYEFSNTFIGGLDFDLAGRLKLPTSSESKFLGTGKTDFALALEASKTIGTWSPYVNIGYRFFGDPAGLNLHNGFSASVGTTKQFGSVVAIFSYDYSRAVTTATEDAHELFAALSGRLTDRLSWTGYGIVGLSEGSPDFGIGLLLTVRAF
jgi:hypothetical protein